MLLTTLVSLDVHLEKAGMCTYSCSFSFSLQGIRERTVALRLLLKFAIKAVEAAMYGDLFMRVVYRTRPYEVNEGETDALT